MSDVVLKKCSRYDVSEVYKHIEDSVNLIGGFDKYFKKNQTILLKINLVLGKDPEYAATTNNIFTEALATYFIKNNCKVIIADSPGGLFNEKRLKKVYKLAKISPLSNIDGISLNYNTNSTQKEFSNSLAVKNMLICDYVKDVDHVISVAKLKTHTFMGFTGAVKNLFGVVPGLTKAKYHVSHSNINSFANMIIDLCEHINPTLSFIDGIVAMEGNGPTGGSPIKVNTIFTSSNPYKLDAIACKLIGLNTSEIATVNQAIKRKLIKPDMSDINLLGDDFDSLKTKFKPAKTNNSTMLLKFNFLKRFKKYPIIKKKKCIGCKECANVCPMNIIDMVGNKAVIKYKKCITCFCCHEFCAFHAIDVKRRIFKRNK